jgi:nitroreductase
VHSIVIEQNAWLKIMPRTRSNKEYKSIIDPPNPELPPKIRELLELAKRITTEVNKDVRFKVSEINIHIE